VTSAVFPFSVILTFPSQIRQLDRLVGTPLVERLPTGIEPTSAGQVVLKQGEAAGHEFARIIACCVVAAGAEIN